MATKYQSAQSAFEKEKLAFFEEHYLSMTDIKGTFWWNSGEMKYSEYDDYEQAYQYCDADTEFINPDLEDKKFINDEWLIKIIVKGSDAILGNREHAKGTCYAENSRYFQEIIDKAPADKKGDYKLCVVEMLASMPQSIREKYNIPEGTTINHSFIENEKENLHYDRANGKWVVGSASYYDRIHTIKKKYSFTATELLNLSQHITAIKEISKDSRGFPSIAMLFAQTINIAAMFMCVQSRASFTSEPLGRKDIKETLKWAGVLEPWKEIKPEYFTIEKLPHPHANKKKKKKKKSKRNF